MCLLSLSLGTVFHSSSVCPQWSSIRISGSFWCMFILCILSFNVREWTQGWAVLADSFFLKGLQVFCNNFHCRSVSVYKKQPGSQKIPAIQSFWQLCTLRIQTSPEGIRLLKISCITGKKADLLEICLDIWFHWIVCHVAHLSHTLLFYFSLFLLKSSM